MANSGSSTYDRKVWEKYSSFHMVKTPRLGQIMAYWSLGLFLVMVLATFLPWTQNIRSRGTLTTLNPEDRPQTIQSTIAGRIEKWMVQEGKFVKKGDTLMVLSEVKDKYFDPDYLLRIKEQVEAKEGAQQATESKAAALRNQIEALRSALQYSLEKAENKVKQGQLKVQSDSIDFVASKTDYEIAQQQFERQEKLYQQGLKSLTELETRRLKLQESQAKRLSAENKWQTTRNELLNARIELNSLRAEYRDKISKAEADLGATLAYVQDTESEISKMNNEYANVSIRSSFYQITAPQDGYVVKALRAGTGENIKEGEAVLTLMPSDPQLAVELFVKPMDIPLISKGRKVRLQFDGWPTLVFSGWPGVSFGTFGGVVAVIDNLDTQGNYRMLVVPDPAEEKWPDPLRVGSGVYGWAMLNDVPIWYELWRQLNGFPPDYVGSPSNVQNAGKVKKDSKAEY
jgi:multidrug resistance efflux pump